MRTRRPLPPAPAPLLSPGPSPRLGVTPPGQGSALGPGDLNHSHIKAGRRACCGSPASPRTRPIGIAKAVATVEVSATPASQGGAPTAVTVTLKHWKDGVRHPQWFSPENKHDFKSQTAPSFHAPRLWLGSACLGCRPPVGRPGRVGGAVVCSPAPAPLCTLWACLCDPRLHIPGPPAQEPAGTQSHVWLEALKRPRAPAVLSAGGHALPSVACVCGLSRQHTQNCPPGR